METPRPLSIQALSLTKRFGTFTAVDAISFQVHQGEIFGFLGANGAGKTTAMRMLCALSTPTSGSALVAGYNVATHSEQVRRRIGYMSQKFTLYPTLTVGENLDFFGGIYRMPRALIKQKKQQLLEELSMGEYQSKRVQDLPLGWKQKLAFSVALFHDPAVVFLDEPTGGVDPLTRRQFWDLIYRAAARGTTCFVTTHYMDEAEYCERVSIMVDGKIAALGTPKELKQQFGARDMDGVFYTLARGATRNE